MGNGGWGMGNEGWGKGNGESPGGTPIYITPYGMKFLREFYFADWRFFVFCGI